MFVLLAKIGGSNYSALDTELIQINDSNMDNIGQYGQCFIQNTFFCRSNLNCSGNYWFEIRYKLFAVPVYHVSCILIIYESKLNKSYCYYLLLLFSGEMKVNPQLEICHGLM